MTSCSFDHIHSFPTMLTLNSLVTVGDVNTRDFRLYQTGMLNSPSASVFSSVRLL